MPITLGVTYTSLYRQVIAAIQNDNDPNAGIVAALGDGANSVFPNVQLDGPDDDRTLCPTPFICVYDGGMRAIDHSGREATIVIEIHDDEEMMDRRWPGILERLYTLFPVSEWRPTSDTVKYRSGLYFKQRSEPVRDTRYNTEVVQIHFCCVAQDRTSGHGYNG